VARDIDRVIDYVRELERERVLPPVMAQVIVDRLDPAPTEEETELAAAKVRAKILR